MVGGETFNATGTFFPILEAATGCDTMVELNLTVHPTYNLFPQEYICQGDTYFLGTVPYTSSGSYLGNLTSQFNCDSVVNLDLTVLNPSVSIANADELDCQQTEITLDGSGSSSGSDISYQWTTSTGNITGNNNNTMTTVDASGMYYLEVTQSGGGVNCSVIDSVEVMENISAATSEAGTIDTLNCQVISIQLDGTGSSTGTEFSFSWTTNNGGTIQNSTSLSPTVNQAGIYYLEVTNANSNCTAIDSVEIISNNTLPIVDAGSDMQIDCANPTVQLDGTASSQGTEFEYQWTAFFGGTIDLGGNGLTPTVSTAGVYELVVTNTLSFCTEMASVQVSLDTLHPIASAGADIELNCNLSNTTLDGSASSQGSQFFYQWTALSGGPIVAGANMLQPQVNVAL